MPFLEKSGNRLVARLREYRIWVISRMPCGSQRHKTPELLVGRDTNPRCLRQGSNICEPPAAQFHRPRCRKRRLSAPRRVGSFRPAPRCASSSTLPSASSIPASHSIPITGLRNDHQDDIYGTTQMGLAALEDAPERHSKIADCIDYHAGSGNVEMAHHTATQRDERSEPMRISRQTRQGGGKMKRLHTRRLGTLPEAVETP